MCCHKDVFLANHVVVMFNANHVAVLLRVKYVFVLLSRAFCLHKVQFCCRELDPTRFVVVIESLISKGSLLLLRA